MTANLQLAYARAAEESPEEKTRLGAGPEHRGSRKRREEHQREHDPAGGVVFVPWPLGCLGCGQRIRSGSVHVRRRAWARPVGAREELVELALPRVGELEPIVCASSARASFAGGGSSMSSVSHPHLDLVPAPIGFRHAELRSPDSVEAAGERHRLPPVTMAPRTSSGAATRSCSGVFLPRSTTLRPSGKTFAPDRCADTAAHLREGSPVRHHPRTTGPSRRSRFGPSAHRARHPPPAEARPRSRPPGGRPRAESTRRPGEKPSQRIWFSRFPGCDSVPGPGVTDSTGAGIVST